MIEGFPARQGWNVHEATRMALRNHVLETDPERFRRLSARAASCLSGDDPHHRIEAVYHRLVADPPDGRGSPAATLFKLVCRGPI